MIRTAGIVLTILSVLTTFGIANAGDTDFDHPLDAHLTDSYTEDLGALLERKYIRVLTTFNRTNFFLSGGKLHGCEYALFKITKKSLNKRITRKDLQIVFEFIPLARDRLIPGLIDGHGDIAAAGLTITPGRQKQVAFSNPYWTGIDEVLVSHRAAAPIRDITALSGERIIVRPSSSYYESLLALNQQLKVRGKVPVNIVPADEDLETEDIFELAKSGAITRKVCDSHKEPSWETSISRPTMGSKLGSTIRWMVVRDNS